MQEILTAQSLWQGFDVTSQDLDVNELRKTEYDGVVTTDLYFSGRKVDDGVSRVYATVCNAVGATTKRHAVIVVGDYTKPMQTNVLRDFALQGFVAMSVDFAGRVRKGLCTLYPHSLDYCNADTQSDIFDVDNGVATNKLFEYAYNVRRAITYLVSIGAKKVSVVTVGNGSNVGLIPLGVDERLANGVIAFGNLRLDYPTANRTVDINDRDDLDNQVEQLDNEQAWTLGLSPQTYVAISQLPLYVIQSTNNPSLDVLAQSDAFRRANGSSKLLILPTVVDYLPTKVSKDVCKWLKGSTNNATADVDFVEQNGDVFAQVTASVPISQVELWYCNNTTHNVKFFHKAQLQKSDDCYVAKLDLYAQNNNVCAFCTVKGNVDISTPIVTANNVSATNLKINHGIMFDGSRRTTYVPLCKQQDWFNVSVQPTLAQGYLKIVGAKGNAMALFSVNDPSVRKTDNSAITLDVCCDVAQKFFVYVICNFGTTNDKYVQQIDLIGDGKWQRVTVERDNFRAVEDGRFISPEQDYDVVSFVAEHDFVINNVMFV